jgi:hypothetical protein
MRLFRWLLRLFGRAERLVPLTEDDAYARSYGERHEVRVIGVVRRTPRLLPKLSGEEVRQWFDERLRRREGKASSGLQ